METAQNIVRVAIAAVLGLWQGLPQVTQVLVWLMVLDVALGVAVSIRDNTYTMEATRRGAFRKVGYLAQLVIAGLFNQAFGDTLGIDLVQAASIFYIWPELASVTRHTAELGAPTFPQLQMVLDKLPRTRGNDGPAGNN